MEQICNDLIKSGVVIVLMRVNYTLGIIINNGIIPYSGRRYK